MYRPTTPIMHNKKIIVQLLMWVSGCRLWLLVSERRTKAHRLADVSLMKEVKYKEVNMNINLYIIIFWNWITGHFGEKPYHFNGYQYYFFRESRKVCSLFSDMNNHSNDHLTMVIFKDAKLSCVLFKKSSWGWKKNW